ncbi:MAG: hypothetical protein GW872_02970 [Nitrospirae bacterium]|nr:hypothetical protein [Nitrospirota bacterium]
MRKFLLLFICLLALIVSLIPSLSSATTEYARQTGFKCNECHAETTGGGKLTKEGEEFRDDLKIKGLYRPLSKTQKIVRFIIGCIKDRASRRGKNNVNASDRETHSNS